MPTDIRSAIPTRVLLVDDHPTVLMGLRAVLSADDDIDVVAAVTSGEECLRSLDHETPDVVLLDLSMPGRGGLETLQLILRRAPDTAVLVLTVSADERDVTEAIRLGASGYLLKDIEAEQLVRSVRAASRGDLPMDPRVTRYVFGYDAPSRVVLSRRDYEVLDLLREGLSNRLIAERLSVHENTVKAHLTSIYARIGVPARTGAAVWAEHHLDDAVVR